MKKTKEREPDLIQYRLEYSLNDDLPSERFFMATDPRDALSQLAYSCIKHIPVDSLSEEEQDSFAKSFANPTKSFIDKPELLEVETVVTPDPKVAEINKKQQAAKVTKKIEASQSQPPSMKGEGASSRGDKPVDLTKLSQKEFDALPEETLRRLRGDFG